MSSLLQIREFKPKDEHTCLMGLLPALYLSTNKVLSSLLYWYENDGCVEDWKQVFIHRILVRMLA